MPQSKFASPIATILLLAGSIPGKAQVSTAPEFKPSDGVIALEKFIGSHASELQVGGSLVGIPNSRLMFDSQMAGAVSKPDQLYDALTQEYRDTAFVAKIGADNLDGYADKLQVDSKRIEAITWDPNAKLALPDTTYTPGFDYAADGAIGAIMRICSLTRDCSLPDNYAQAKAFLAGVQKEFGTTIQDSYILNAKADDKQADDKQADEIRLKTKDNVAAVAASVYLGWVFATKELAVGTAHDPVNVQGVPKTLLEIINQAAVQQKLLQDGNKIALQIVAGPRVTTNVDKLTQ